MLLIVAIADPRDPVALAHKTIRLEVLGGTILVLMLAALVLGILGRRSGGEAIAGLAIGGAILAAVWLSLAALFVVESLRPQRSPCGAKCTQRERVDAGISAPGP